MKSSELIIDIGMHKGEDTDYYLRKGFTVLGVEADPDLAAHCRDRFAEEIRARRLSIVEGAIVPPDYRGEEVVFFKNRRSVFGTINADWVRRNDWIGAASSQIRVPVIDMSELLGRHGSPFYMKVDIEGTDLVCVQYLQDNDEKPDYISLESDKTSLAGIENEISALQDLGYDSFMAVQQAKIFRLTDEISDTETYRFESGSSGPFGPWLAGEWVSGETLLEIYRGVFEQYRRFGDDTVWAKTLPLRVARALFLRLTGIALPGWYDTHARHSSVSGRRAAPSFG